MPKVQPKALQIDYADRYVVKLTAYHRKESALKVFARPAAGPLHKLTHLR